MTRKLSFLLALFLFVSLKSLAQMPNPVYKLVNAGNWVKSKNYYLLTLLEQDKDANALLKADPQLARLTQAKLTALQTSFTTCKDALCLPAQLKFTAEEIKAVSARLVALYKSGGALDILVKTQLIPSGTYI
jgi:hypothetical protein